VADHQNELQMASKFSFIILAAFSSLTTVLACDIEEPTTELMVADQETDAMTTELADTFDWDLVPVPAIPGVEPAFNAPAQLPAKLPWNVETFRFFTNPDFLTVTQAAGGVFTPSPAGMQPLPPDLAEGFMLGFTFRDEDDNVVGFGSIQEVVDFESASAETHYMMTIPGRGTLFLAQQENNAALFAELGDMIANQDYVRSYDPPLVFINTVPGTNRIVGGTGEFAHAKGIWREFAVVNEFNLLTGVHDVGNIVQIVYF
jgi:hypothetical protein